MNQSFSLLKFLRMCLICLFLIPLSFCSKAPKDHPFAYDLHLVTVPGNSSKAIVCFHGMGMDYKIIDYVEQYAKGDSTLISFNFPDHGIRVGFFDPEQTQFGSIKEILPALYVLKKTVIDSKFKEVTLYGFSAGGGAIINMLAVLNTSVYDKDLKEIGIQKKDKKKILAAIQKGRVLLDAPLKSLREMIEHHEKMVELEIVAARYEKNSMEPIDNISKLDGLGLHFILNFQSPDEVLSNRDDQLYIERLKQLGAKSSVSFVIEGEGHGLPHPHLWDLHLQSMP